jgi:hypothetical protein
VIHAHRFLSAAVRVVVLAVAASALGGCDVVVSSMHAQGKAQDEWSRSYPVSQNALLEIVNGNGEVNVTAGSGSQVEVKAERTARAPSDEMAQEYLKQVEIVEEVSADRVRLETKAPRVGRSHAEIKYHVMVPAGLSVRLKNTNGAVTVVGLKGEVRAETTNGSVKGRELSGTVEATTTNGGVSLDVTTIAAGGIRAETTNGGVDLRIPGDARADIRAAVLNGGISLQGLSLEGGEKTRRRVEGRLNGGGPNVSVETTNGGIKIAAR